VLVGLLQAQNLRRIGHAKERRVLCQHLRAGVQVGKRAGRLRRVNQRGLCRAAHKIEPAGLTVIAKIQSAGVRASVTGRLGLRARRSDTGEAGKNRKNKDEVESRANAACVQCPLPGCNS